MSYDEFGSVELGFSGFCLVFNMHAGLFLNQRERKRCVSAGDDLVSTNLGVDIGVHSLYLLLVLQFVRSINLLKHSSTLSGDPRLECSFVNLPGEAHHREVGPRQKLEDVY